MSRGLVLSSSSLRLPAAPLSGVIGGAVLHRCILEIDAPKRTPGARAPPKMTARVHQAPPPPQQRQQQQQPPDAISPPDAPAAFAAMSQPPPPRAPLHIPSLRGASSADDDRLALSWQEVRFLDGQPHIRATLRLGGAYPGEASEVTDADSTQTTLDDPPSPSSSSVHSGWFRLALGVGGTSAASELVFVERATPLAPTGMMAGPGEGRARLAALNVSSVERGSYEAASAKSP